MLGKTSQVVRIGDPQNPFASTTVVLQYYSNYALKAKSRLYMTYSVCQGRWTRFFLIEAFPKKIDFFCLFANKDNSISSVA